jgi:four helix bundle protein
MFGLTNQMRRAAVSVPSNIAEGHGRLSDRMPRVFLAQARGSLFELETQTQLAQDLQLLQTNDGELLLEKASEIGKMLNGLIRVLES